MTAATVLLVDDDVAYVKAMVDRLSTSDLLVMEASSGEEAMSKLAEDHSVEVVILDVAMPGMDGIDTLREIKKTFPLVEVIMLTGEATVNNAVEGMKLGAFDYLLKPCNVAELVAKVNDAAKRKREHENRIIEARMRQITHRLP